MPAGHEHLDTAAQAHHAALDGGILESRRQSVVLAPVACDLASLVGEFELETLASAARGHRVPALALLENEEPGAVLACAPAVGQAPRRRPLARAARLPTPAGVELRQGRERQLVLACPSRRDEELGAVALDQGGVEFGAHDVSILHDASAKSEISHE